VAAQDPENGSGSSPPPTGSVSRITGEWMYVFKPDVGGQIIYVKVMLREACLVVSFHEDEGADHEEDE